MSIDVRDNRVVRKLWAMTPEPARRVVRRARGSHGPASGAIVDLPIELTADGSRRELPVPDGSSREELFEILSSVSIEQAPPAELLGYLTEDFERFVHTWNLARDQSGKALEIGANPYFTTVLLREFTTLELTLTNSFDPNASGVASQIVTYRPPGTDVATEVELEYHHVNVESAVLPFDDATFDVVLFCEVLEHLLSDPVHALLEMKRVLRQRGVLVLSTPNVARLENVARLAAGANMYDPYSGHGPYGRHNREYTRHEVTKLLQFVGFDVLDSFTCDVHAHATDGFVDPRLLAPLVGHRLPDLGQYLFFKAVNARPARVGRPSELFRSLDPNLLVDWD